MYPPSLPIGGNPNLLPALFISRGYAAAKHRVHLKRTTLGTPTPHPRSFSMAPCMVYQQMTLAHAYEANQRIVDQLNDQVDFLNRQLANREAQLAEVGGN